MRSWQLIGYVVIVLTMAGCIGLRSPLPPDDSPVPVPPTEGTVSTMFADMITETPVLYTITFPNPGGVFQANDFDVQGQGLTVTPTLHFKPEEALAPYVARYFNVWVPPFEDIPGAALRRSSEENHAYYAAPVNVNGQAGWLVVEFTGADGLNLARYTDWFATLVQGAEVVQEPAT